MNKKKVIYLTFLICGVLSIRAQNNDIDPRVTDLKSKVQNSNGTTKLKLLDSLCALTRFKSEYQYDSIVKATIDFATSLDSIKSSSKHTADYIFYLANRAGKPAEAVKVFDDYRKRAYEIDDPSIFAQLYLNGADGYFFAGKTHASIQIYKEAGEYALQAKDSVLLGKSKIYMSDAYADSGKFAEAASILSKAQEIFENTKDTLNLLTTYNSRANLYSRIGFYKEAKQVRDELIKLAKKRNDYRMLQSTYYNIAIDNSAENNYSQRIYNLNEALKYAKLGNFESYEIRVLISLLQAYSASNKINEATTILNIINEHPMRPKDGGLDDFTYTNSIANYHLAIGDNKKVISLGKSLLKMDSKNDFANSMIIHNLLAKAYEEIGNSKDSYVHYKIFSKIRDSINTIQKVRSLTYYQTLYETKKRDATIDSQKLEISLLDAENKINRQWMLFGSIGLIALFSIIYLIRSRKFVASKQELQEQFSHDLISEQEKERAHLARELHDSVGQKLMLLSKTTKTLGNAHAENLASSTLEEVRSISRGLHPSNLERLGLTEAIKALLYDINANTDLFFTEEIEDIDGLLSKDFELHLFRIIQESLSNIVKHSEAKAVKITIQKDKDAVEVFIDDNGKGFEIVSKQNVASLGLKTLFERAKIINGIMNLKSSIGNGATITLNIPL